MAAGTEPGKRFGTGQLDRQFRKLVSALAGWLGLDGDYDWTGTHEFDCGQSAQWPGGEIVNPVRFRVRQVVDFTNLQRNPLLQAFQNTSTTDPDAGRRVNFISFVENAPIAGLFSLQIGDPVSATLLTGDNGFGIQAETDIVFSNQSRGLRFYNFGTVLPPLPTPDSGGVGASSAVVRWDLCSAASLDNPPGITANPIPVTTYTTGTDPRFGFQYIISTEADYADPGNTESDPRVWIRSGRPDPGEGAWNGEWGGVPVIYGLQDVYDDVAAYGGASLSLEINASYPDGRRLVPFKQQSAALYIDYTDAIKPGPFAPGAPITFNGGFGYNTPEAAFSILAGTLSIPAGNAGAYSLSATFSVDIGTGATGILGVHDNGVAVQGLASAASTGNQNTTVTVVISGIFPMDATAHTIDIRVMPTSATVNVVNAGQFWIKREFL